MKALRIWLAFQRLRLAQRQYAKACKRLARDVEKRRNSENVISYRVRRKAALRHTRGIA